jgi:hypothetical protein
MVENARIPDPGEPPMTMRTILATALLALTLVPANMNRAETAKEGVFVGVGYGGRRLFSRDGKAWEIAAEWSEKGGDDSDNLMSVLFAQGKFVAVGGGSPKRDKAIGGHILVSSNGKDWKEVYTARFRVHPVLFGNDRFVAGGPNRNCLYSTDGETWREGVKLTAKEASHFRHGAFGNGVFVFIGNAGGNSPTTWVAVTRDGEKLDHMAVDLPVARGLVFANGVFVAVGPDGRRLSSKDGKEWTERAREDGQDLHWVTWTGTEFVCGGGKTAYRSPDGSTWEKWPAAIPCSVLCVTAHGWVGTSWPGQMWYSADGKAWMKCPSMPPNGINGVFFGVPESERK